MTLLTILGLSAGNNPNAGFPLMLNNDPMEAQSIHIALHDESAGYPISPRRVPLAVLRAFAKDVDELLRGDAGDLASREVDVAVIEGSLAVLTLPTANPGLLQDLLRLSSSELIDGLNAKRRSVIERWQKAARSARKLRYEIRAPMLKQPVIVSADSDFRADDADQWVRVERYVQGEIFEMGGLTNVNAHIRLPDGKTLVVDTDRELLRTDPSNRLFKPAMARITAEYNVVTREYRNARLIEFVTYEAKVDEKGLERLAQRGAKAWADVPDAGEWIDALRGNDA